VREEEGVILISGAIPGKPGSYVVVRPAKKVDRRRLVNNERQHSHTRSRKAANIELVTNGKYTQAVHETVVAYRANRRSGTASVKTKATVNGSGAKPWKQKGTGRARAGYKSSPCGPAAAWSSARIRATTARRSRRRPSACALRKALSARILAGDVLIVRHFAVRAPKTKDFVKLIAGISPEPKTLVVGKTSMTTRSWPPATCSRPNSSPAPT
jgi:50S ribosomal protein L4